MFISTGFTDHSSFADPVLLAGDVNIHVERAPDPDTVEYVDVLAAHGLVQLVSEATHDAGGTLDVVCVRGDLPLPAVHVVDVGLSNHRLLRWTSQLHRPPPLYTTAVRRRWTLFDVDVFRADLLTSPLCDVGSYVSGRACTNDALRVDRQSTTRPADSCSVSDVSPSHVALVV